LSWKVLVLTPVGRHMIYISAKSLAGIQPIPVKFFLFEPAREADVPTARNLIFLLKV